MSEQTNGYLIITLILTEGVYVSSLKKCLIFISVPFAHNIRVIISLQYSYLFLSIVYSGSLFFLNIVYMRIY